MRPLLALLLTLASAAPAQTPAPPASATHTTERQQPAPAPDASQQPTAQPGTGMTVNTGAAHAAILDAEHRPITAGGFVKDGPVIFEDITAKSGLAAFHHVMGAPAKSLILETLGSGVALLDYDNDGWLDIYLVNGGTWNALAGKAPWPHAALFHNNHDGTFTDVSAKAGVTNDRWGFGAVIGDYDNDGWPDIYVSNYGKNRLFHNNHNGTFTDVAEKAGVTLGNWSAGATWGDYDGDGRLDLFVPGYVHYDLAHQPPPTGCQFRGAAVMCGPRGLEGEPDHLFHNNGDGTFTDVSVKLGVNDTHGYYGLASLFIDLNGDGKPDLLVADDSTPNYLYLNKGNGAFEDASFASGYALNESGRETASMGIAAGDYTHNGLIDLYNTTFSDDYKPLYRNDGDGNFTDISYQAGIAEPTIPFLSWGTSFFDYDNDGWLDLLTVNGHVYPEVDSQPWGTTFAQRAFMIHNNRGKLEFVPAVEGTGLAKLAVARGLAYGDLFNSGHVDVVINNLDSPPSLFRNVTAPPAGGKPNHWIAFKLIGAPAPAVASAPAAAPASRSTPAAIPASAPASPSSPGKPASPRDAVGATIFVTANGFRQRQDIIAGGSFASSPDQRPHFGLGPATKIDKIEIHWPSGLKQDVPPPTTLDTFYTLTEGKAPTPYPQP